MNKKIVVIEDDRDISEMMRYNLAKEWFSVCPVYNGSQAVEVVKAEKPILVLLDIMLPAMDGFEICRRLKLAPDTKDIPIIMLTAKGEEADIIKGFQLGADDYIVKPFSPRILLERIKAVLRRSRHAALGQSSEKREIAGLTIDLPKRRVTLNDKILELTALEFDILELLSRAPGRVFTREQIIDSAWKEGRSIIDRAVDVHISGLRVKLGIYDDMIETVRGVGYRFRDPDD